MFVVQHGVGPSLDQHKAFGGRTKEWAESHGCVYVFSSQREMPEREEYWEKAHFLLGLMKGAIGSEFLCMDPDTWVMQKDVSPCGILQEWADLAIAQGKGSPFNAGVFFIRSNARTISFMEDVLTLGDCKGIERHEQGRMSERLQYHSIRLQILPWVWNAVHCTNLFDYKESDHPPIIKAYHGYPDEVKFQLMENNLRRKAIKLQGA